jgi:uncharacterized surface protein with fasciclin (FAS1) repeats
MRPTVTFLSVTTLLTTCFTVPALAEILDDQGVRYRIEHYETYKDPYPGWEMLEALRTDQRASNFALAVEQVGLVHPLNTENGFTAFVPVDSLFTSQNIPAGFFSPSNPQASEFLSRHVVNSRINPAQMHGNYERFETVAGTRLSIQRIGNRYVVNGEPIVETIKTPYGFIHLLNGFVERPGDIATAHND